jgi:diaminopimelate decarboxylase
MNERDTLKINSFGELEIAGIKAVDLAKEYGTPLYVFDKTFIKEMCKVYSETLKNEYGEGRILYASKAFSCKEIYRIVKDTSLGVDVVSGGELYTARSVDFDPEKIYFHGNNKTYEELNFALNEKIGTIVIDSYHEADTLQKLCEERKVVQKVLIRINPGVEAHTHHYIQTANVDSKFGFSISKKNIC